MEEKPDLKRPKTKKSDVTVHESDSEMHRSISMGDREGVKKLLKKGEKLCCGTDVSVHRDILRCNCFILAHTLCTWSFMKFLLSIDPVAGVKAKNFDGLTLLMLYAKEHKVKEVQLLFELGADLNECSNDGNTALMYALLNSYPPLLLNEWYREHNYTVFKKKRQSFKENCQYIIDLYRQSGADFDVCNANRENALHIAVKNHYTFQRELLQSLIGAGIDPTVENNQRCTVLSYAMETFVQLCDRFAKHGLARQSYQTLLYVYDLLPFHLDSFQIRCSADKHPCTHLLRHLSLCQALTGNISIFVGLITSNEKLTLIPESVVYDYIQQYSTYGNVAHRIDTTAQLPFAPLTHYLYHEYVRRDLPALLTAQFGQHLLHNLRFLMANGYTINVPTQETLSPLTVGLMHQYSHFDYVTFARLMLDSGAHVEQRMLKYVEVDAELEQLSVDLCLPDVLRVALSQADLPLMLMLELIKMFLPHFAHPALTLLPFVTNPRHPAKLFPTLSSYGPLQHFAPHTTAMQRILKSRQLSEDQRQTFNTMNESIPTLQQLSRTVVRSRLAQRASQTGNSLPGLIKSVPPLTLGSRDILVNVVPFIE